LLQTGAAREEAASRAPDSHRPPRSVRTRYSGEDVRTAAAAPSDNLETLAPRDLLGKAPEPVPSKNVTDADVFTLVTTVQQIMVALKIAEKEDAGFAFVMKAVSWKNKGLLLLYVQHTLHLSTCLIHLLL
jgi:hypothetical protein